MFALQETSLKEIDGIFFKLEYQNPSGSVKDRGVMHQIEEAKKEGYKNFVVSSSGNAALSAKYWTEKMHLGLTVFVSPNVNKGKLSKLRKTGTKVIVSKRPISDAIKFAKNADAFNLRASTDPNGYIGYKILAKEILNQVEDVGSVFIPASSGTLCYGVASGFDELNHLPQIHVVQTTYCNIIASHFDTDFKKTETSLADALVAKTSVLKEPLIKLVQQSAGSGWVVKDNEIEKAWKYLKRNNILTSFEGAATLAAVQKAKKANFDIQSPIVCLLSGKFYKSNG